ncbi:MAG: hypothetical protein JJE39_02270 [Vicinamibacteria bacterium]|nr:hypothetical protein [Vicinamibacteria bacterium]
MLEKYPVLKRALANQYQVILVGAAATLAVATISPLPFLLLLGGEFMVMPFMFERLKRRLEIEKKYAARQSESLSQNERYDQLHPDQKLRYDGLKKLCRQIQGNYRGLTTASQGILAEYTDKFEAILATCLRRLWLVRKYDSMIHAFDVDKVKSETERLTESLAGDGLSPRVAEAWKQNLEIKQKLLAAVDRNIANREALLAELDSLESLFQLLLQKSLAATDAQAFSQEMDDLLSQADQDEASVKEMEQLLGSMPELSGIPSISDEVGKPLLETPEELQPFISKRVSRGPDRNRTSPGAPAPPRRGERSR